MDTLVLVAIASGFLGASVALLLYSRILERRITLLLYGLEKYTRVKSAVARLSQRPRRRYIVFEVMSEGDLDEPDLARAIATTARRVLGEAGYVESGIRLILYNKSSNRGILRVNHTYKYRVLGVLGLVRRVRGRKVMIIPLGVTGSVKRARRLLEGRRR